MNLIYDLSFRVVLVLILVMEQHPNVLLQWLVQSKHYQKHLE
jgi:hypothetical protein